MHDDFTLIVYLTGYHVVTVLLIFTVLALCPMGRYFKKLEKGKIKTKLTLEQTLDCMYDIQEKKCIADDIDIAMGLQQKASLTFLATISPRLWTPETCHRKARQLHCWFI